MTIQTIPGDFSVCSLPLAACVDLSRPFCFAARTDNELSLVCPSSLVPNDALEQNDGWSMLRIAGTLDFSLVGILSKIAAILADEGVSIFAVSTYGTDYLLVKAGLLERVLSALRRNGYQVEAAPLLQR